jgi:hypothetical protein
VCVASEEFYAAKPFLSQLRLPGVPQMVFRSDIPRDETKFFTVPLASFDYMTKEHVPICGDI